MTPLLDFRFSVFWGFPGSGIAHGPWVMFLQKDVPKKKMHILPKKLNFMAGCIATKKMPYEESQQALKGQIMFHKPHWRSPK